MGKLKNAMIEAQEQFWNEASPDLSMDDLVKEDVLFRFGLDVDTAIAIKNLMELCSPPEALYYTHPEIYDLWWNVFLVNDDKQHDLQLDLFEGRFYG